MDFSVYNSNVDFSKQNPSQFVILCDIAYSIINKDDLKIFISKLEKEKIAGIFNLESKSFNDSNHLVFFFLCSLLKKNIYKLNFDLENFCKLNDDFFRKNALLKFYYLFQLSCIISDQLFNFDVSEYFFNERNRLTRRTKQIYFQILPNINFHSDFFLRALEVSTEGIKPEHNYLDLYVSIRTISKLDESKARQILCEYNDNVDQKVLLFPNVIHGLTEGYGIDKSLPYIIQLLESNDIANQTIGIRCLSMLGGRINYLKGHKQYVRQRFNLLILTGEVKVIAEILYCYSSLLDQLTFSGAEILDIISKHNAPEILFALSHLLWRHSDSDSYPLWYLSALDKLTVFDSKLLGIYRNLDMAFIGIERHNVNLIYRYLTSYIEEDDNDPKAIEGFKHLFGRLAGSDILLFQKHFTLWLNNDNSRFHVAVARISSQLWIDGSKELSLSVEVINSLSFYDIEFILYKIVGYFLSKDHLQSLVYSSLKKDQVDPRHLNLVAELFVTYISYNFPGSSEFLEVKKIAATPQELVLIDFITKAIEEYYEGKKDKPKELVPSPKRLQIFFSQRNKGFENNNEPERFPENRFIDFVHKITTKNGKSFFSRNLGEYGKDQYSSKSEMTSFSSTMEFPGGEFTDPVGQAYKRFIWVKFKRRQQ